MCSSPITTELQTKIGRAGIATDVSEIREILWLVAAFLERIAMALEANSVRLLDEPDESVEAPKGELVALGEESKRARRRAAAVKEADDEA